MSRIYWDTMLFIYWLDGHPTYFQRVIHLLDRAHDRGDKLYTSYLSLGEVMTGPAGQSYSADREITIRNRLGELGFSYLPFDDDAVSTFSKLRGKEGLKIADSIHMACAASAGIDMFLTGDKRLLTVHVPGIKFIADFNTSML